MGYLLSFFVCSLLLYLTYVDLILALTFAYKVYELLFDWIHTVH